MTPLSPSEHASADLLSCKLMHHEMISELFRYDCPPSQEINPTKSRNRHKIAPLHFITQSLTLLKFRHSGLLSMS